LVQPQIQDQQCVFRPGSGTVDQLFTPQDYWRGPGSLPNQTTCALLTGEGFGPGPSEVVVAFITGPVCDVDGQDI